MKPPFAAFLIQQPKEPGKCFCDAFSVRACTVLAVNDANGTADVLIRTGSAIERKTVQQNTLASNRTRLMTRLEPFLSELAARAPQPAVAVMTAADAERQPLHLKSAATAA